MKKCEIKMLNRDHDDNNVQNLITIEVQRAKLQFECNVQNEITIGWNVQVAKWKRNSRVDLSPPRCYGPPPPQVDPVGGCTASNANITCHISSCISCLISCYIPRNCR